MKGEISVLACLGLGIILLFIAIGYVLGYESSRRDCAKPVAASEQTFTIDNNLIEGWTYEFQANTNKCECKINCCRSK